MPHLTAGIADEKPRHDEGNGKKIMARVTGLEPATSGVTGRRSNQLSYTREASSNDAD